MACDITTYRAHIGCFYNSHTGPRPKHVAKNRHIKRTTYSASILAHLHCFYAIINIILHVHHTSIHTKFQPRTPPTHLALKTKHAYIALASIYLYSLILMHGDIHPNPGPTTAPQLKSLPTFFLNARSLKAISTNLNKLLEFKHLLFLTQPYIMAVSETWLTNKVLNTQIDNTKTFNIYRKDRPLKRGGGVLCMINSSIRSDHKPLLQSPALLHNEIIVVEVEPSVGNRLAIIIAYRSQKDPPPIFLQHFETTLNNCINAHYNKIMVLGDFNFKDITWNEHLDNHLPPNCQLFMDITHRFGLTQLNTHPSRHDNDNILDLVLTNFPDQFSKVHANTYTYTSDHFLLDFDITCMVEKLLQPKRTLFNFKKSDHEALTNELPQLSNTLRLDLTSTINHYWTNWSTKLLDIITNHIPKITLKNSNSAPWVDAHLHKQLSKKNALLKHAKKEDTNTAWAKFKKHRNHLKNLTTYKHRQYLIDISENLKTNPKQFWSMLKNETKSNMHPTKIIFNGMEANTPTKIADLLNQYFQSIFTPTQANPILPPINHHVDHNLSSVTLSRHEILKELNKLNVTKASGPDNIPTRILKDYAHILVDSITTLFNKSLSTGTVPQAWKHANIIPIHKKGSKTQASNYRPISLLPVISKILERCIYNKIIDFIIPKLASQQHGFLRGRSTTTQLLTVLTKITSILDTGNQADIIYFDLSKAFDSVPHKLLIHKLKSFGFNGKLLEWLSDYLTNRSQRVIINGSNSSWLHVTSGVPQGSILGPLLFLLYINDLPSVLSHDTICAIFADDTKIYRQINTRNDALALQNDITNLHNWSLEWGLRFNENKCTVITVKRNHNPTLHQYNMGHADLPRETNINDLGIIINKQLKWNAHIDNICTKANQRFWLIIRTLGTNSTQQAKLTTYIVMVRSLLEYATPVWSPTTKENLIRIELIQRKATNYIMSNPPHDNPNHITYKARLIACKILPTSYRREFYDIIFFLKSIKGMIHFDITKFTNFLKVQHNRPTRNRALGIDLSIPSTKLESTAHFYPSRIARLWNTLPPALRTKLITLTNFNTIKKHLSTYYNSLLHNKFNAQDTCTWISACRCTTCRPH